MFHKMMKTGSGSLIVFMILCSMILPFPVSAAPIPFFEKHCFECHDSASKQAGLDLTKLESPNAENFVKWVRIHDRIESGEMPPKAQPRPPVADKDAVTKSLKASLIKVEQDTFKSEPRSGLRRLTRAEYENTIRDLFDMPGIALQGELPPDGSAHGFDKNSDALDISHVNLAKYIEAAEHVLNIAIATRPNPPSVTTRRISLANSGGFVAHVIMNGDGVLLKDKKPDPDFPPAAEQNHIDEGAHERMESFNNRSTVGLFRHEDESLSPYFIEHVTIYPGLYRVRTSLWSFQWDKGQVLPSRGTEAARLSVVQLTGDGRGGQHPSYKLGYFDAPSMEAQEHQLVTWLNHNELIGFNVASLAPVANYNRKGRAMAFTGPGIACDWLDIQGPLHNVWPPFSHIALFGELPLVEFKAADHPGVRPPQRKQVRQLGAGKNRPDPAPGLWTVQSEQPLVDADRLLKIFLPRAFRRPVDAEVRQVYVAQVDERLKAGECFESAMRWAYRAALCSPDFLYHVGWDSVPTRVSNPSTTGRENEKGRDGVPTYIDDYSLACRLSYFFLNSMPDGRLTDLAARNILQQPRFLQMEVDDMLKNPKSQRFIDDFLGQWLKLRQIAATDPDKKLYPEFNPYLQDSMVAETRAYFRELIEQNLSASHLIKSDFAMLNEKLAVHYGIPGVTGSQIRRVPLPPDCPRGGFLTQASILKITANGTTTSPVPRGAFVMDRLLGQPPDPPPPNIAAVEPDVRGATTIREQLAKHRDNAVCASCHAKMDPPGFALEAFDVIGGPRSRYRSIGDGEPAPRGAIDPFIGISFKLGPPVDSTGVLPDGRSFKDVLEFQTLIAADSNRLLMNLAERLMIYATGRDTSFSDRDQLAAIVAATQKQGGGIRTLIHEVVQSPLFQNR